MNFCTDNLKCGFRVRRVEPLRPAFSELVFPVFLTTSMVAMGLPNTGKYLNNERTVGDCRG
jgi:hypothetical protein